MRDDLISLKIKASKNLIFSLMLCTSLIVWGLYFANIVVIYKLIALTVLAWFILLGGYRLIWHQITYCDLLLLINTAVIWNAKTSTLMEIKSIRNVGAWLIQIKLHAHGNNKIKYLILSYDSIEAQQFKYLMRYAKWTTTKKA